MNRKQVLLFSGWLFVLFLITGTWSVNAQQAAPTATKGVTPKLLVAVNLGPEIEGMGGRQLRMRTVTVEPGGVFEIHSHKDRPGTVYILQGKITEHRGDIAKEYGPGEFWFENKETMHWLENKGAEPVVFIAVDIFNQS